MSGEHWIEKLREPTAAARTLYLIESNATLRVALGAAIEVLESLNDDEINVEILPELKAALES